MKAYAIKKGKRFSQSILADETFGSLKTAELFSTKKAAKEFLFDENEKIVPVEIKEVK